MSWLLIIDIVLCKDQMENLQIIDKLGYKQYNLKVLKKKKVGQHNL